MSWLNEQCLAVNQSPNGAKSYSVTNVIKAQVKKAESRSQMCLCYRSRAVWRGTHDTWHCLHGKAAQYNQPPQEQPPIDTTKDFSPIWRNQLTWYYFLYLTLKTDRRGYLRGSYHMRPCSNLSLIDTVIVVRRKHLTTQRAVSPKILPAITSPSSSEKHHRQREQFPSSPSQIPTTKPTAKGMPAALTLTTFSSPSTILLRGNWARRVCVSGLHALFSRVFSATSYIV